MGGGPACWRGKREGRTEIGAGCHAWAPTGIAGGAPQSARDARRVRQRGHGADCARAPWSRRILEGRDPREGGVEMGGRWHAVARDETEGGMHYGAAMSSGGAPTCARRPRAPGPHETVPDGAAIVRGVPAMHLRPLLPYRFLSVRGVPTMHLRPLGPYRVFFFRYFPRGPYFLQEARARGAPVDHLRAARVVVDTFWAGIFHDGAQAVRRARNLLRGST